MEIPAAMVKLFVKASTEVVELQCDTHAEAVVHRRNLHSMRMKMKKLLQKNPGNHLLRSQVAAAEGVIIRLPKGGTVLRLEPLSTSLEALMEKSGVELEGDGAMPEFGPGSGGDPLEDYLKG